MCRRTFSPLLFINWCSVDEYFQLGYKALLISFNCCHARNLHNLTILSCVVDYCFSSKMIVSSEDIYEGVIEFINRFPKIFYPTNYLVITSNDGVISKLQLAIFR